MAIFDSACPTPKGSENYGDRGTAWKPMLLVALACLGATAAISASLIILHLRRYRAPKEQRQIIRIAFSVIVYSTVAFFEIYSYEIAQYIDPIGDIYESIGLCALFLLFIQYAAPSGTFNEETFDAVKSAEETQTGFNWPKISWIFVFQYPIVEFLCVVIQEATEATGHFCVNSLDPQFAHLWVEIIESLSIGACVLSIWKFRGHMRGLMKMKRGLSKLAAFKIIVFIRFTQAWAFSTLLQYHAIKVSSTFSYNDILYGIPGVLTCAEMVLFSGGFWYAYSSTEYGSKVHHETRLPVWKAVLDALNPTDIIVGIARIFPLSREMSRTGDWKKWRTAMKETGLSGAIRKGIRKYKGRKGGVQGRYQELDEGLESISRPTEMHTRSPSDQQKEDMDHYSMSGGLGPNEMYQPPTVSPPYENTSYLSADASRGRPRAASQSSVMEESSSQDGRPRAQTGGEETQRRYDQTPSPSPARFTDAPTQGRDMY